MKAALSTPIDISLLEQHAEQLATYGKDLSVVYENLVALDLEDSDALCVLHTRLEELHFTCSHKVRKLLTTHGTSATAVPATDAKGLKLPKLPLMVTFCIGDSFGSSSLSRCMITPTYRMPRN